MPIFSLSLHSLKSHPIKKWLQRNQILELGEVTIIPQTFNQKMATDGIFRVAKCMSVSKN